MADKAKPGKVKTGKSDQRAPRKSAGGEINRPEEKRTPSTKNDQARRKKQ